jgi:hypothetical protein
LGSDHDDDDDDDSDDGWLGVQAKPHLPNRSNDGPMYVSSKLVRR